jgi:hypothetical protein
MLLSGCASVSALDSASKPAAAKVSAVPSAIDFKSVVVGQKNSQTVKITNPTSNPVTIKSLHVSGAGFSFSSARLPILLAPGSHTELSVAFAPGSAAAQTTGAIVVSGTELRTSVNIPLSGSGERAAPALTVSPSTVNFGARTVKTSTSQSASLSNTGNIALSVNSIGVTNPAFSVSGVTKGVSLSPGQKVDFQIWFRPTSSGKSSANITFESSNGRLQAKLAASGSASTSTTSSPATASHSVTLDWSDHNTSAKGYYVYRGELSGGPFSRINQGTLELTTFKDTEVLGGSHYYYVVTAVGESGPESPYSNEVSVVIPDN